MKHMRRGGSVTIHPDAAESPPSATTESTTEPANAGSSVSAASTRRVAKAVEAIPPTEAADAGSATHGVTRNAE